MNKPPVRKTTKRVINTALRLPTELHGEIRQAADRNGRSMNAEIVARLQESPLDDVKRQNDEIKAMIRQLLDRT